MDTGPYSQLRAVRHLNLESALMRYWHEYEVKRAPVRVHGHWLWPHGSGDRPGRMADEFVAGDPAVWLRRRPCTLRLAMATAAVQQLGLMFMWILRLSRAS